MPKCKLKEENPALYRRIKAEQDALKDECPSAGLLLARICPYCGQKIELLSRGNHSSVWLKCPDCGEEISFPPIYFRTHRSRRWAS